MKQVNEKSWSHKPTGGAYSSTILSITSDSGIGTSSGLTPPPSNIQAYLHRQNLLMHSMPERERQAQAAAIALISNSPQPDQLDRVSQSMPPPVNRERSSTILSITSDSGIGTSSGLTPPPSNIQAYLHRQTERVRQAQAAAIALISNSPPPDQLDWVSQSMPSPVNRERHRSHQAHSFVNYPRAHSSDDSSSPFILMSQSSTSDLFIPKRLPRQYHSDSDDPHHFG